MLGHAFLHVASWTGGDTLSATLQMVFLPLAIAAWNSIIFWMFRFGQQTTDKRIYGEKTAGMIYNIMWWVRGYGYAALGLLISIGGMLGTFGAAPMVAIGLVKYGTMIYDFVQWGWVSLAGLWFYFYWKQLDTLTFDSANFTAESTQSVNPTDGYLYNGLIEIAGLLSMDYWISSQMGMYAESFTTGVAMNGLKAEFESALASIEAENDTATAEEETSEDAEDDFFFM